MIRTAEDEELFGNNRYEGYCADLAKAICRELGINYELRLVKDGKYGEKMSNGTWNGMVGELTRKVRFHSKSSIVFVAWIKNTCKADQSNGVTNQRPPSQQLLVCLQKDVKLDYMFS